MERQNQNSNESYAKAKTSSVGDMTVGSPLRQITKFALPLILGYAHSGGTQGSAQKDMPCVDSGKFNGNQ